MKTDLTFHVSQYDHEGDKFYDGIFIYVGTDLALRFNDVDEIKKFGENLLHMIPEIESNISY